jgi:hypothetical protein
LEEEISITYLDEVRDNYCARALCDGQRWVATGTVMRILLT